MWNNVNQMVKQVHIKQECLVTKQTILTHQYALYIKEWGKWP